MNGRRPSESDGSAKSLGEHRAPPYGGKTHFLNFFQTGKGRITSFAIYGLALVVLGIILLLTIQSKSELKQLSAKLSSEQATYERTSETNRQLIATNNLLGKSVSHLTEQQRQLQLSISVLERKREQLEATNNSLNNELKNKLDQVQRGQWADIVEAQIVIVLKNSETGLSKAKIVEAVRGSLPAVTEQFISETFDAFANKGQMEVESPLFGSKLYRLKRR